MVRRSSTTSETVQPNILVIMADQFAGTFIDENGPKEWLHAPNLREMFADGVTFTNAQTPSPLCAPSRASIWSSRLPSDSGVYDNGANFSAGNLTYMHLVRLLGYETELMGKMHFVGPDQRHGAERRRTTDIYPSTNRWTPDYTNPLKREEWHHNMKSVLDAGPVVTNNQKRFDEYVIHNALGAITDYGCGDRAKPFFQVCSFTEPHDPYECYEEDLAHYPPGRVPPPTMPTIPYDKLDPHSKRLSDMYGLTDIKLTTKQIDNARRAYCANISCVDRLIGNLREKLEQFQLMDNTIIVFLSDHGDMLGEKGLWYKMSPFKPSMTVPFMFYAPQLFAHRVVSDPVSLCDFFPTVIELGGGRVPHVISKHIEGISLLPMLNGGESEKRLIWAEYIAEGALGPMIILLNGNLKLVRAYGDPDMFFDLKTDPLENVNLSEDPKYDAQYKEMCAAIDDRYDLETLQAEVICKQQERKIVYKALKTGVLHSWDHEPNQHGKDSFIRDNAGLMETEAKARFPRLEH